MTTYITRHCKERFSKRIAKTNRMPMFISAANRDGILTQDLKCGELRRILSKKEEAYGRIAKVYKNCVYWFADGAAVTVYPLAQKYHGRI